MREIVLCDRCQGSGELFQRAVHRGMDDEVHMCSKCNGTGRTISFNIVIEIPFNSSIESVQEIENELLKLRDKHEWKCKKNRNRQ